MSRSGQDQAQGESEGIDLPIDAFIWVTEVVIVSLASSLWTVIAALFIGWKWPRLNSQSKAHIPQTIVCAWASQQPAAELELARVSPSLCSRRMDHRSTSALLSSLE